MDIKKKKEKKPSGKKISSVVQLKSWKLQPCSDGNCAGNYCSSKFDYRTASIKVIKLGFKRNWNFQCFRYFQRIIKGLRQGCYC